MFNIFPFFRLRRNLTAMEQLLKTQNMERWYSHKVTSVRVSVIFWNSWNSSKQNIDYARQQVILRQLSAGQEELEEASSVTLGHARSRSVTLGHARSLCFLWWLARLLLQFLNSSPDKKFGVIVHRVKIIEKIFKFLCLIDLVKPSRQKTDNNLQQFQLSKPRRSKESFAQL